MLIRGHTQSFLNQPQLVSEHRMSNKESVRSRSSSNSDISNHTKVSMYQSDNVGVTQPSEVHRVPSVSAAGICDTHQPMF